MGNITLDRLMRPRKEVALPTGETVVVRALASQELSLREAEATRAAALAEKEVRTPGTPRHDTYILRLETLSEELLRNQALEYASLDAWRRVEEVVKPDYIPEPEEATEEERRATVLKREEHLQQVAERRRLWVESAVATEKARLEGLDRDRLLAEVTTRTHRLVGDLAYREKFLAYTKRTSTLKLDGQPYFSSDEEALATHPAMDDLITRAFVEVNDFDPLSLSGTSSTATSEGSTG